jgi:CHAD domain-containing protein
VSGRRPEFLLEGTDAPQPGPVVAALGARFVVADAGCRAVRRVWLDTFDWRLHRAGLALAQISDQRSELALSRQDGEQILSEPASVSWPSRLDALRGSALRDRLDPVVGVRALLPVAETEATLYDLRLLNADEKTVVRITVEEATLTYPLAAPLRPRVVLAPVRGYPRQAARAGRLLAATPGIVPAAQSGLETALTAAGRQAGDYTGRVEVQLTGSAPATQSMAAVLLHLLDTLETNLDGVLRDLDTEFLHDLRVAVRRTRSALKLTGDTLPAELADRFAAEFRWLGDLTTPVRDLDVYLLGLGDIAADLDATGPDALQPFQDYLAQHRLTEHRLLLDGLRSPRFATLTHDWRAALTDAADSPQAAGTKPGTAGLAATRVRRAHRTVVKRGSAITPLSPAADLHDLRKRCKELRYLLEFFASLHDPATHRRIVKELKALQDCLGEFQDSQVQRDAVATFAEQMMADGAPAATLLAMGALTARLDARQRQARSEFAATFNRFSSRTNTKRMRTLTTAARA